MLKTALPLLLFALILASLAPPGASGGEFRVYPIRLDLASDARTGTVKVLNDADEKLNLQMKLFKWTQDAQGKDTYTESSDLIYHPKLLTVEPKDERVVRVGIKAPGAATEAAYRLYIEEIPSAVNKPGTLVAVKVAIRFGLPIFVSPGDVREKGSIDGMEVLNGTLKVLVRNTGNVSFTVTTINVRGTDPAGAEAFSRDINGWYLLPGASRLYSTPLEDACARLSAIRAEVKTANFSIDRTLDVNKDMCGP